MTQYNVQFVSHSADSEKLRSKSDIFALQADSAHSSSKFSLKEYVRYNILLKVEGDEINSRINDFFPTFLPQENRDFSRLWHFSKSFGIF